MLTRMARTAVAALVMVGGLLALAENGVVSHASEVTARRVAPARAVDGCREEPAPRPLAPAGCIDPEAAAR